MHNYTQLPGSEGGGSSTNAEHSKRWREERETYTLRQLFIHIGLVVALLFVWLGFNLFEPTYDPPEFENYIDLRTIDETTLNLGHPDRRLMFVGDLHGMMQSFDNLMSLLQYNHKDDLLIHLGDLCAKGPHSNELVTRFAAANMTGVRGNNDQKVIDWYSWFEWVKSHPGGDVWLAAKMKQNVTPRQSKAMKMYKSLKYRFPKDWEWNGDHYQIAAKLSPSDYAYLTSLPIVIHLPSLHTFVVHAGLLPMDPAHHPRWLGQPLGHPPDSLPETNATAEDIVRARFEQESALLTDIEPNTDRYIKLNIRDVHDYQPVRRGPKDHDDNEPWSELWNRVIKRCRGFESDKDLQRVGGVEAVRMRSPLPCYPITVVYSHASGRGLDLKRWSKGLDTGCVNGNGLTAMILGKARNRYPPLPTDTQKFPEDDEDERDVQIKFGEGHKARLVSVSCPTPPPVDFNKRRS